MIELYYPLKPISINQPFGNASPVYTNQGLKGHNGIDFFAKHGQSIYAAHDGTCYPGIDTHGGNGVTLRANDFETIYWHLIEDDAVVHTGQIVKAGDLLGYADSTGVSTGDHLHFGLAVVGTDPNNGYHGYSDPAPYFNGKYAQDISNPVPPFTFKRVIRLGAWSNDVKQLQTLLQKQGLYTGATDGVFGPITEAAVKRFQTSHGLISDGICGPKTNQVLNTFL